MQLYDSGHFLFGHIYPNHLVSIAWSYNSTMNPGYETQLLVNAWNAGAPGCRHRSLHAGLYPYLFYNDQTENSNTIGTLEELVVP